MRLVGPSCVQWNHPHSGTVLHTVGWVAPALLSAHRPSCDSHSVSGHCPVSPGEQRLPCRDPLAQNKVQSRHSEATKYRQTSYGQTAVEEKCRFAQRPARAGLSGMPPPHPKVSLVCGRRG